MSDNTTTSRSVLRPGRSREAVEAVAIAGYRSGKLSAFQASRILGLSRLEFEGFLKERNVLDHALAQEKERLGSGRSLAAALAQARLPADEARAWRRDLNRARKALKAPADRWR